MINWHWLALVAVIQSELALHNAVDYKRIRVLDNRPNWTLPVEKEPSYLAFDDECLPIESYFEVDHVELKRMGWFYRKQLSNTHDCIYVYAMLLGVSSKCKKVVYYLFEPKLWELVERGK